MGRNVRGVLLSILLGGNIYALPLPQPQGWVFEAQRLEPDPLRWLYVAHNWSGGEGWDEVQERYYQLLNEFKARLHPRWSASQTLLELSQFLRQRLFHQYEERQSRIDVVLREHRYNCVSSTVLVMIFARMLHFPVEGLWHDGHVLCQVKLSQGKNVYFDFSQNKKDWSSAVVLNPLQVVNLIAQNAIVEAQRAGQMAESLQLAVNRWYLEGIEPNKEAFFLTVNNVLADLNGRSQVREAYALAQAIQAKYGTHPSLDRAMGILSYNLKVLLQPSQ